jgi:hypothetical protein
MPPGIDPGAVRLVVQRLNHYATPGPKFHIVEPKILGAILINFGRRGELKPGIYVWCMETRNMWWKCATSRKVAGSIRDGVTGIFHRRNTSRRSMVLGSTQFLKEMSTRNISCETKGGRCVLLTTLPPSCADCASRPDIGLHGDCFTFAYGNKKFF